MIHRHHIIPRHDWKVRFGTLRGFNAPDNIVYLTIEQHSQTHQFLYELHGRHEDYVACKVLAGQMTISEGRELVRRERIKAYQNRPEVKEKMRLSKLGKPAWNKGLSLGSISDEHRKKLKGRTPWNKGLVGVMPEYKHSEATINIICRKRALQTPPRPKGFKMSSEHKEKLRIARFRFLKSKKVKV